MNTPKAIIRDDWVKLILGSGLLFGIVLRTTPGLIAGFPLNDGGMFLRMIQDLGANNYILPITTTYNLLDIPYAYPPLGFYIARIISDIFLIPEIVLLRWLPVIISVLSILAFHLLAQAILKDRVRAALATAFLAVTPGGYFWHIMGGGLTRSLGALFLLLSAYAVLRLFDQGGRKNMVLAVSTCSLAVLSHPEIALYTLGTCALFWLFYGRTRVGALRAFWVVIGTLLFTSIWWLTVIFRFGFGPFLSVLHAGLYGAPFSGSLKIVVLSRLSIVPILLILRLAGVGWCLWRRQWLLVAWVVLPVIVEPRSSSIISLYPLSMLAAVGFTDTLLFLINWFRERKSRPLLADITQSRVLNLTIMSVILYLFLESLFVNFSLVENSLKSSALDAMEWTRMNTPPESQFLVLTGDRSIMTDPLQEWFPALADRKSQTTLQGLEWTLGSSFLAYIDKLADLQSCESRTCIENWSNQNEIPFSHLIMQKNTTSTLLFSTLQEGDYLLIYEDQNIAIFDASDLKE
ncbi:MAG: hypothetical protein QGM50_03130 [Anaerolineae bacterium]|nr:hypothetical protein [Anaerolineae bacterium]